MPVRRTFAIAALLLSLTCGCAPDWQASRNGVLANATQFSLKSTDVTMAVTLQLGQLSGGGRRLFADVGRCQVVGDGDGTSGLVYPLGPADPPPTTRTAAVISLEAAGSPGGAIDLIRSGDTHIRLPEPDGPFSYALLLPLFVVQPFDVLPDRLAATVAAPGPVAPALVELARDLVDCPAVGVAGTLRGAGLFTARLSLTDAGRAKLRAALAKRSAAATRPA